MGFNLTYGSILFVGFYFGKIWKVLGKQPFFRADMAGLGKYRMGGYGRIGVYRATTFSLHGIFTACVWELIPFVQ